MAKTFDDLVTLMDRLRAPDGCPWDREQNVRYAGADAPRRSV